MSFAWLVLLPVLAQTDSSEASLVFDREIRPLLAERCLGCHGRDKPEGGLRLADREGALAGGESGTPAIIPGKPDEGELMRRILTTDPTERMPPEEKEPLLPAEIAKLRKWIESGAPWGRHWSLQPITPVAPPAIRDPATARHELDRFVLSRLETAGLNLSPEADRYTLIRRLYYDLVGLPPTIEDVAAFVNDPAPQAYETVVERLLRSPHFGERWGRHWLDLAHYADSDGYEKDRARPDAYLYRDWVIQAIHDDLPFDRFTIEQLAGDLLPNATPAQRVATGFLRQTLTNEEGGVDQEEYRIAAVFDRTETVGTVWLGLTVGCVRCHSHKYDPLPHDDYYRLFAFFNNADEDAPRLAIQADDLSAMQRELAPLEAELAQRLAELAPHSLAWETELRAIIMKQANNALAEHPLQVRQVESLDGLDNGFEVAGDAIRVAGDAENRAATDTYRILAESPVENLTGFKLTTLPDANLPGRGAGRADNGNFVVTGFRVWISQDGEPDRPVALHRAQADFSQQGFSAEAVLQGNSPDSRSGGKTGWAVAPKTTESHWLQFRTLQPWTLPAGARLKIEIAQHHGAKHTLGRFKLTVLTGNERGLQLANTAVSDALEMYPEKRIASTRRMLFDYFVKQVAKDERVRELEAQIGQVHARHHAKLTEVRTISQPRLPRKSFVFDRGEFLSPKHEVEPGTPGVLGTFQPRSSQPDRLDLAQWLVSRDNPLTPRVAVNHVWKHLFGEGLVRTLNDFGVRGEPPTHPELLDWLADKFRGELHWSRKKLIRLIVTSATYRQSSRRRPDAEARDPANLLLHRQNRFRVEGEIVRDLHLAVAGLLSPKVGGPSVFPPMPDDLAKLSYANNFSWKNSTGEDRYRRGMYTFFKRTIPHPNLTTFDCPDANVACVTRPVSNTPLQALTLLNNDSHVEASQALARRLVASGEDERSRLERAVRLCVSRPPASQELAALAEVLRAAREYFQLHPDDAIKFAGGIAPIPPSESAGELAAWVAVSRVVLNYDQFITRE